MYEKEATETLSENRQLHCRQLDLASSRLFCPRINPLVPLRSAGRTLMVQRLVTSWTGRGMNASGYVFHAIQNIPPPLRRSHPNLSILRIASFPEVKRPGRRIDHPLPSSAKLQMGYNCTPAFPLYLHRHVMGLHLPLTLPIQ